MASSLNSHSLLCLLILAIFTSSEAKDFLVGGNENAWRVPPTTTDSLNQWAENNRFQVGDSLVWKYDAGKDSVLQVTREAYLSCNKSSPIAEHKDGATVVELRRSGAYYFISGAEGACEEGEKLIVVVLSDRHSLRALGLAPAPAPAEYEGPAVAPTSGAARSTAAAAAAALSTGMMVVLEILLR
ncbi:early nodulin-like protein 1 [Canna indica]|uniref:Early nodulin-like protein 1 n=1 Tax=Canna indica TaxID=4628 RepID=A0AAQ3JS61_9LILI|nr:early nodulin-like protein 1 [Canna indica]